MKVWDWKHCKCLSVVFLFLSCSFMSCGLARKAAVPVVFPQGHDGVSWGFLWGWWSGEWGKEGEEIPLFLLLIPFHQSPFVPLSSNSHNGNGHVLNISSVQSLSCVWLFATPWTAACQASLSIANAQSLLKLMSIESVMPSTISSSVVPCSSCLQSFPAPWSFPVSQFFTSGGQSVGVSPSVSVLPMNIQDWFPLGWTGWISLQSKGLSRVFSNTTVQKHQFFGAQLYL